jgi:hypothetical protein
MVWHNLPTSPFRMNYKEKNQTLRNSILSGTLTVQNKYLCFICLFLRFLCRSSTTLSYTNDFSSWLTIMKRKQLLTTWKRHFHVPLLFYTFFLHSFVSCTVHDLSFSWNFSLWLGKENGSVSKYRVIHNFFLFTPNGKILFK